MREAEDNVTSGAHSLIDWQIAEIKRGLIEADAGNFATDAEVEQVLTKWKQLARKDSLLRLRQD